MASSKVGMPSSSSRNSDLRRRSSLSSSKSSSISDLNQSPNHRRRGNSGDPGSMSVDGLLRNGYGGGGDGASAGSSTLLDAEITLLDAAGAVTAISDGEADPPTIRRQESAPQRKKTVDDVWREIVEGRRECKQEAKEELMTLEDFLAKAEAEEEAADSKMPLPLMTERSSGGIFSFGSLPTESTFMGESSHGLMGFGNGAEAVGGRGKRRASLEPLDKAAQQRQRRMIKNRESAARSRERKQAYQVELESLAVKLEEENERLLKEKAERVKGRYKQLMENVVPLVEKRRPRRVLRRVRSMEW